MAYTITVNFPVENINSTPDTYQLILVFDINATGANETWNSSDKGLLIIDHGKLEWSYDIEDALIVPATTSIQISDRDDYLDGLLFGETGAAADLDLRFSVEIKINGTTDFLGHAVETSIKRDLDKVVSFEAIPKIDLINKKMAYDTAATPQYLNPFSYIMSTEVLLTTMISDIYGLVNSSVTVSYSHNWVFHGLRFSPTLDNNPWDFNLTDLKIDPDAIWFNNDVGISTVGDALKILAQGFGAYTGMKNENEAFFKKIFFYDGANTQTISTPSDIEKIYKYGLIDYVRIVDSAGAKVSDAGTFTKLQDRFIEIEEYFAFQLIIAVLTGQGTDDGSYYIQDIKDVPDFPTFTAFPQFVADWWFFHRGDMKKTRVDIFKDVPGVTYDFLKNFTYNTIKYQIIRLTKDFERGVSDIEALHLGT